MRILNTNFWSRQRAMGWRHFVFVVGVFQVALPTIFLGLVVSWWWANHTGLIDQLPGLKQRFVLAGVLGILVGVPIFGILWGVLTWKVNEWLYRRYTAGDRSSGA
jgi:hypothetical protein